MAATDNSSNLFAAIKRGDLTTVQQMLGVYVTNEGDATPNVIKVAKNVNNLLGMWNSTPLIVAVQYGQLEIANLLLATVKASKDVPTNTLMHNITKREKRIPMTLVNEALRENSALRWCNR